MKKVLIGLAIVVVVVVAALAIIPHFLDLNSYRTQIQAKLQAALGRPVDFKDINASFLPPSVKVSNVSIGEDPRFGPGPFATIQQLDVSVKLLPLLSKDVEIQSLTLERPQIQVVRNKQGEWNYASLGKTQAPSQPGQPQANPQTPPAQQPSQPAPSKGESQFSLSHLTINNGKVGYLDQQANTHGVYDNIDATLNDFAPGKTFDLNAAVRVGGKSDQRIEVSGNAGPIPDGNNAAFMPFDGTITLTNVPIAELQAVAQSSALQGVNGIASGKLAAKNEKGLIATNGTLKLDQANVRGVNIGYPITLDLKANDDTNSGTVQIENGTLKLGTTPVSITGSMNTKATPSQVNMNLAASNVSIAEVVRLASSFGVGLAPGTTAAGQLTANIHAAGAVDRPALNGNLTGTNLQLTSGQMSEPVKIPSLQVAMTPTTIHTNQFTPSAGDASVNMQLTLDNYTSDNPNIQFDISGNKLNLNYLQRLISSPPPQQQQKSAEGWSLIPRANAAPTAPASNDSILQRATGNGNINVGTLTYDNLVLTNVQSKVTINRGVITASPLTANLYTGTETGSVTIDTRTNPSTISMNTKLQHVDANGLLSSVSSAKNMLYGLLASNANARFQAASAEDITRTLNGTLSINLTNGKFTKLDIMNQLASVGKFLNANATANKGFTDIQSVTGTFNVVNGVAQTNDLKAVLSGATLASQGTINMVNNTVNMKANAVLSKEMSGSVGGNGVGGMMQTALANKNGELVIPVLITGSLDSPHVAPDMESVANMKMQNMLPSLANPSQLTHGGVSGVIGALTGQQQQQGNQKQNTNQQQQQNPLGDALGSILGGNKKPK